MPTGLVLLSNTVPTTDLVTSLGAQAHPGGVLVEFRGGAVRQFVDSRGEGILTLLTSRPVEVTREADAALRGAPVAGYRLWTDLTIPFGDLTTGRALAEAIAEAVGGEVREYA